MNHRKSPKKSVLRATLTAVWTIGIASLAHGNGAGILQRNYFGPSKISSNQEAPKEVRKATAYVEPKSKSAQQKRTAAKPEASSPANQVEAAESLQADSSDVKPPKEAATQTPAVESAPAVRVEKATMAPVVPEAPIVPEPPAPVVAKAPDLEVPPLINPTAPESRPADAAGNFHADEPASTQPPVPPPPQHQPLPQRQCWQLRPPRSLPR